MDVLLSAEMGEADRRSAEFGVSLGELMERAGAAVARFCERLYPAARRVVVICGRGNNGGDGLVAARCMERRGVSVRVLLLGRAEELRGEAAGAFARLRAEAPGVSVEELRDGEDAVGGRLREDVGWSELIVDAVFGTGFKPPLRGLAVAVRDALEVVAGTPVVAVDVPSGWDADGTGQRSTGEGASGVRGEREAGKGGSYGGEAFRADAVLTFTAPKPAHVFGHLTPGRTFGAVVVAEIGSPAEAVRSGGGMTWTGSSKRMVEAARDVNSHKGRFGHVLLVGGSYGKAGAPSMAALAALRSGAGLVTAAVPESILNTVALITPELMLAPLLEGGEQGRAEGREQGTGNREQLAEAREQGTGDREEGALGRGGVGLGGWAGLANLETGRLEKLMKGITVLAIGPGLSTDGDASAFARGLVEQTTVPVVIDADALNAFAGRVELLKAASGLGSGLASGAAFGLASGASAGSAMGGARLRTVVLTPHPGEMARLLGTTVKVVEADRVGLAREFATANGVTLVLKGWRTLVAHPDGRVAVNTSGNPGMAKGGSGDILTGIVAALLAQFPERVAEAVEAAVYLHGLAADMAVGGGAEGRGVDEHTLLATDTVAHLSDAFRYRVRDEDGFTWICGLREEGRTR